MRKKIIFFIILGLYKFVLSEFSCQENQNYCRKCNPLTNLCIQCFYDSFIPDNQGGCTGKCIFGKNYCIECGNEGNICKKCEDGYYPDKIGGCTTTENCQISYNGKCDKCNEGYILVGEKYFKICKNLNLDDFKNCELIDNQNGLCAKCEEGFYLNKGDNKCTKIENCYESLYGVCSSCLEGYYLNVKKGVCQKAENSLINCKQTLDEINCDICNKFNYLSEDGQCTDTNMCSKTNKTICEKCISGYKLLENGSCTKEENCKIADKDTGICKNCLTGFYLNDIDKKCRTNRENNEFKNCELYNDGCKICENGYYISGDLKCVKTRGCDESENGICLKCSEGYFMGLDKNCSITEHCIYSGKNSYYSCDECEENYVYEMFSKVCFLIEEEKFENCKLAYGTRCNLCHKDYYLNSTDSLCYDNTNENDMFYKCEKTDYYGKFCSKCIEGYYLTSDDNKCTKIEYCKIAENENKCLECEEYFCLDVKKQECILNDFIEDENDKIYINCNRTNEEGTKCEICLEGYEVDENGFCVNYENCLEEKDGICQKCGNTGPYNETEYCANSIYGCMKTFLEDCKMCDDIFNLYACTECEEGFIPNIYGICILE